MFENNAYVHGPRAEADNTLGKKNLNKLDKLFVNMVICCKLFLIK